MAIQAALDRLWSIAPGNLGVRVFFVISGYLITGLLLAEHQRSGTIRLGRFYLRRAFRIMPAFYAFLTVMAVGTIFHWAQIPFRDLLRAAGYTTDYLWAVFTVGHSWSLAVEEQFYLLWPGILFVMGVRRGFRPALAMLVVAPVMRAVALLVPHWPIDPMRGFDCVADALATGCLLARYRKTFWASPTYRRVLESGWMTAWPLAVVLAASIGNRLSPLIADTLGLSVLNILIAIGVDRETRLPGGIIGRGLNVRPVAYIGALSYSIYLWQQPFLETGEPLRFPMNLIALLLCAVASYYLIERPFLRLRAALETRWRTMGPARAIRPAEAASPR